MSKLDLFKESTPTDWDFLENKEDIDEIIIGGSCTHTFELPFVYETTVKSSRVLYSQGLEVKLAIPVQPSMVQTLNERSIIYVYLPASFTSAFEETLLDAYCQLEITTLDGRTYYDQKHKLKVLKPLEHSGKKVVVNDITVNGESVIDEEGNANIDLSKVITDMSDKVLFVLGSYKLSKLIEDHVIMLSSDDLTIPEDFFEHTDVAIKAQFGEQIEQIRFFRNDECNMIGVIALKLGADIYEVVVSVKKEHGLTYAILRSATIY
jgi:hypothetical protein